MMQPLVREKETLQMNTFLIVEVHLLKMNPQCKYV